MNNTLLKTFALRGLKIAACLATFVTVAGWLAFHWPAVTQAAGQIKNAAFNWNSVQAAQQNGKAPQPAPTPQPLSPDEAKAMAEEIHQLTNRSTEGLQERKLPNGAGALDLQGRFQNVPLARRNEDGSTAVECVDDLASASEFLGINPTTTKQVAQTKPSAPAEFRAENRREGQYIYPKKLSPQAATIVIVNNNAAGVGFNDPTPVAPVGGNTGTTLGQQRLIAFQEAANIWGAALDSNVTIVIRAQFTALTCTATSAVLGSAGALQIFNNFPANGSFPGAEHVNTWYHVALANKRSGLDLVPSPAANHEDLNANFNSNLGQAGCLTGTFFYLGLDNNHGTNIDLVAVLLHEFAHGLGFSQFASVSTGVQAGGFTDVYGRRLLDLTTNKTWNQMTNAERIASAINSRKVAWTGTRVTTDLPGVLSSGTPELQVNTPAGIAGVYLVGAASFGPQLTAPGITADVVQALDPADVAGPTTFDACSPLTNAAAVAGKIALVDRGTCGFTVKVKNAQDAGALAVIVADNVAGSPPAGLGGTDPTITIPSVRITLADGNLIKAQLGTGVNATLRVNPIINAGSSAGGLALVNTPNPVQPGSSVSHWDTSTFPNQLMEPSINGDLTHSVITPQDLTLSLFRDIGWFPDANLDGIPDGVVVAPTIHKVFGAFSIQSGGNTTVTLTLMNSNASPLTNASFTDTLVNMSAVGGAVTGTCVGTTPATLTAGATALSFSGITIPSNESCTLVFSVTSNTLGTHSNATSGVTTTQTPTAGAVSNMANLTVYGAPTIAKAFAPMAITAGGTAIVTVMVSNPNPLGLIAAFSDTLANMSAVGGVVSGSCALLAPITLAANATALSFNGVILPASGSCSLSFGVRSNSVGTQPNATSGVTTDRTPTPGAPSNTAMLTVNAPMMTTIAKAFSPATIPLGGTSTVQLTLTNTNPVGALASFTDNLTGMVAVGGNIGGTCGLLAAVNLTANATNLSFSGIVVPGGGNCVVTFDVKGTVAGAQTNTTSGVVTDQTTPNAGPPSNTATLTVVPTTVAKAFNPASIVSGGTSTVSLTLNNGNAAAVLASLTDTLANMTAVGGPIGSTCGTLAAITIPANATNLSFSGIVVPGGGSCTVSFAVTSSMVGVQPNTTSGVTMNSSGVAGPVSNTANLTVTASLLPTLASKAVRNDFDGDGKSDLPLWNKESGELEVRFSSDNQLHRIQLVEPNSKDEYIAVAEDYDGDKRTDAAVMRVRDGLWVIRHSLSGELVKAQFGLLGDVPMPADYDGDERADLAVWRERDGLHIQRSSNLTVQALYLGEAGDVRVIGDFNGDGLTDVAAFREGRWQLRDAATGQLSDVQFGQAGDIPFAADVDGDGRDDLMRLRPAEGIAYVLRSSDHEVMRIPLGSLSAGEAAVFGDYNGDRKYEPAIWRKTKAAWEILFR